MAVLLIAEDVDDVRSALERVFAGAGFTVLSEPDGVSALRRARITSPDIVLTDFDMPGMNGLELCRAIRADPQLRDVPVAVLSGGLQPGDARISGAQLCAVLLKPISNADLVAAVRDLVESGRHEHGAQITSCAG